MSRLRGNPTGKTCQQDLGVDKVEGKLLSRGVCAEPAVIRCNACKQYFCDECWIDHLEMSVVLEEKNGK